MAHKQTPADRLTDLADALRDINLDLTTKGPSRSFPEPGDLYSALGAVSGLHVRLKNLMTLLGNRAMDLSLDDDLYCTTQERPVAVLRSVAGHLEEYAGVGEAIDAAWSEMGTIGRTVKAA